MRAEPYARAGAETGTSDERPIMSCDSTPLPALPTALPVSSPTAPPNYLVWAILSTVLCCLPLGIASIVFSTQVNGKWAVGDAGGAQVASRKAKSFAIWAAVIGLIVDVVYGVTTVLLASKE